MNRKELRQFWWFQIEKTPLASKVFMEKISALRVKESINDASQEYLDV